MAFVSNSAGSNYAERTADLGGAADKTLMCHWLAAASGNDGIGLRMTGSDAVQNYIWSNGSNTYSGYSNSFISSGTNYSTTTWHLIVLRLISGVVHFDMFDGTTWTDLGVRSIGAGASVTAIGVGYNAGSLMRNYAPNGAKFAYLRYWPATALTDGELEAERTSATAVKAGASINCSLVSDLVDSINGYDLTAGGSYTLNTDVPPYVTAGASAVKKMALLGVG